MVKSYRFHYKFTYSKAKRPRYNRITERFGLHYHSTPALAMHDAEKEIIKLREENANFKLLLVEVQDIDLESPRVLEGQIKCEDVNEEFYPDTVTVLGDDSMDGIFSIYEGHRVKITVEVLD